MKTPEPRKGAMTRAMSAVPQAWLTAAERAMRVAIARGGRIEEERLVRQRLVVGPNETCDVVLCDARFGGALFESTNDGWVLHLPSNVAGRVADRGGSRRLEGGDARTIQLGPDARGKLELADGALLFHLVAVPPPMPKPQLPASVRLGLLGEIDWNFTAIIVAVFSVFLGGTVFLEAADWPIGKIAEEASFQVALNFIEPDPPPAVAMNHWAQHDPSPQPADPEVEAAPAPTQVTRRPRSGPSQAPVRLTDELRAGISLQIGSLAESTGQSSALQDLIRNGADTSHHADLFTDVGSVQQHASNRPEVRNNTSGSGTDFDGPVTRGPIGEVATGPVTERAPFAGHVHLEPFEPIDVEDGFDTRVLARRIRGKSRLIARCYETEITRQPDLAGRVDVEITVMPAGNVRVDIARNSTGSRRLGECINRHLRTIRLANGPADPAIVGFPFVFAAQR